MCVSGNYVQAEIHIALKYQIKDISGLHQWISFIFSPIINKTMGLKLL